MKNVVIVAGIFAIAFILGPTLAQSKYNAFDNTAKLTPTPTVQPTPVATPLPRGVLFDDTLAGVGQVFIDGAYQFTITITEDCPPSKDYARTYLDGFGPNGEGPRFTMYGSHFTKQYTFTPGKWEFYIDNICPLTHVVIRY